MERHVSSCSFQFTWHNVPEREKRKHASPSEPVASPTMMGGHFAIDRHTFERLGTYDPGFDIWGCENLELAFKAWMCGGSVEIVPCSHVGHVFRSFSPYKWREGVNVYKRNAIRLAQVWMDDYKKYYFEKIKFQLVSQKRFRINQRWLNQFSVKINPMKSNFG